MTRPAKRVPQWLRTDLLVIVVSLAISRSGCGLVPSHEPPANCSASPIRTIGTPWVARFSRQGTKNPPVDAGGRSVMQIGAY